MGFIKNGDEMPIVYLHDEKLNEKIYDKCEKVLKDINISDDECECDSEEKDEDENV